MLRSFIRSTIAALVALAVVPSIAGAQYVPGPRGMTGPQGEKGTTGAGLISGAGAPSNGTGSNGDFYVDTANYRIYGPKSGGTWGVGSISLGITVASPIAGQYGGTGVSNVGKTITLSGNLATSGAYNATFTLAGDTNVSFPVTGTLLTTTGNGSGLTSLNATNISTGVLAVGVGGTGTTTATGSGSVVRATNAVLIAPTLGAATGTSLALGGATPGSNDLAVNGTAFFDSNVTIDAAILFGTANTAILSSSGVTGQFLLRNGAGSAGGIIDVSTDATFRLRNRANSADADLELGSINAVTNIYASGSLVNSSTANNASIRPESTGTIINRNIADANPALTVRQQHASSTGNLITAANSAGNVFAVTQAGAIDAAAAVTAGTHVNAGASSNIRWTGRAVMQAPATDRIDFLNSTGSQGADITAYRVGLGTASFTGFGIRNDLPITGATDAAGYYTSATIQSGVTAVGRGFRTNLSTAAASFTLSDLIHYSVGQGTIGAGSTVTNQSGFYVSSNMTGATNNYGFRSDIASAANRWNFYAGGTAANYFAGATHLGTNATFYGSSSGTTVVQATAAASGTLTLPATTGTLAVLNSPAFTGTPTTPTASPGTGGTQIASQAYVDNAVSSSGAVPTGTIMPYAGFNAPGGYFFANGQAVSRTTYAALFNTLTSSATVTMTIASPGVITWTAHGFIPGMPIVLTTTGALPTGLTAGTTYYVVNVTTNTFELATTINGSSINTSGSQSGTHTARAFPFGVGDGSTTFNVPDFRGRAAFGVDNMGGVAAASRLGANSSVGGITYNAILGTTGGSQTHVQTVAELAPHTHAVPAGMVSGIDVGGAGAYLSAGFANNGTSGSTGTASPMNITPPALVVNYIIRQRRRPMNDNRRSTRPRQISRRAA